MKACRAQWQQKISTELLVPSEKKEQQQKQKNNFECNTFWVREPAGDVG